MCLFFNQCVIGCELVFAAAGALEAIVKALATFAYPSYLSGGNTSHKGIVGDVVSNNSACCD